MASGELRQRLERALQLELPEAEISEEVLAALLEAHEEQGGEADNGLIDVWVGFLIMFVPNPEDDEAVREICRGVLRRLSEGAAPDRPSQEGAAAKDALTVGDKIRERKAAALRQEVAGGPVPGLQEWLTELDILVYDEPARRWCEENKVRTMDALAQRWEAFCDDLSLKRLQRIRVQKTLAGRAESKAPQPPQPKAKPVAKRTSGGAGEPTSFGPADNPYSITRCVGTGATARVYECNRGGKVFAAKVISLATMKLQPNFEELRTKLRRETDILFNLRHERIVSLYETYETDDYMILVMEFVQGGELFQHMGAVGRLVEDDARRVFLQLVDALTYIHEQRVVHRDLKLENILVYSKPPSGKLEVKVSDFGHSKLIKDGMSTAQTMVGTQQYWAPEVALAPSAAGYDFSVDLWSLGVVLYVMLEGLYPFDGPQMADQIRRGDVQFSAQSQASPDARDLVRRLIQVEHRKRISLRGCLEHAWCLPAPRAAAAPQAQVAAGGRKGGRGRRGGAT